MPSLSELQQSDLSLVDRWILSRLARATAEVNRSVEQYNLHEGARHVYAFFWHEFCDWYLEMIKLHPERSKPTLLYVFESALRLLHPFMPFITEELWQNIPHKGESIVIAPYPEFDPDLFPRVARNINGPGSGHHCQSAQHSIGNERRCEADRTGSDCHCRSRFDAASV